VLPSARQHPERGVDDGDIGTGQRGRRRAGAAADVEQSVDRSRRVVESRGQRLAVGRRHDAVVQRGDPVEEANVAEAVHGGDRRRRHLKGVRGEPPFIYTDEP